LTVTLLQHDEGGAVRNRLRSIAVLLLGALLFGTAGLSLGSWYGGRGAVPLSEDRAQAMAAELFPGAEPTGSVVVARAYRYGVFLAPDDYGSARVTFQYGNGPECALSDEFQRNATSLGWQDLDVLTDDTCDGRRAESDGVVATLTHEASGSRLNIMSAAPDKFLAATLIGTLLGAAAGAALFGLVGRWRRPVPVLVRALVTVGLLPGVALTWQGMRLAGLTETVWPIWQELAPLLMPFWLALLVVGVIAYVRLRRTGGSGTDSAVAASETRPGADVGHQ